MRPPTADHILNFSYEKSSTEIVEKATAKATRLKAKIEEREERIRKTKEENGIDAEAWATILEQLRRNDGAKMFSYNAKMSSVRTNSGAEEAVQVQERTIAAGVINDLLTERSFIDEEKEQMEKLVIIARNLKDLPDPTITSGEKPLRGHKLNHQELVYLGF